MLPENRQFDILLGTYEHFLLGYGFNSAEETEIVHNFANKAHTGSVRCVAVNARYAASGSSDEIIRLFDMHRNQEIGSIAHHDGSINDLEFFGNTRLLSASDDSDICMWSTGNWEHVQTFRGHKSSVNSLSVHPSGKVLLSVSKDKTLRTWNMIMGNSVHVKNLGDSADLVQWCPDGEHFVVGMNRTYDVYSATTGGIVHSINFGKRVGCMDFLNDHILAIGGEGGTVEFYDIESKSLCGKFEAHEARIKSIRNAGLTGRMGHVYVTTASSAGHISVWDVNLTSLDVAPDLVATTDSGCRIIAAAIYRPPVITGVKRKSQLTKNSQDQAMDGNDSDTPEQVSSKKNQKRKIEESVEVSEQKVLSPKRKHEDQNTERHSKKMKANFLGKRSSSNLDDSPSSKRVNNEKVSEEKKKHKKEKQRESVDKSVSNGKHKQDFGDKTHPGKKKKRKSMEGYM